MENSFSFINFNQISFWMLDAGYLIQDAGFVRLVFYYPASGILYPVSLVTVRRSEKSKRTTIMNDVAELKPEHKYLEVAERIEALIEKKILKVGDKLLSVRALSKEQGISLSTAF